MMGQLQSLSQWGLLKGKRNHLQSHFVPKKQR